MTMDVREDDWVELAQILESVEEHLCLLNNQSGTEKIEACRQALKSFHTTAAMLGLGELERLGIVLESALFVREVPINRRPDDLHALGSALSGIIAEIKKVGGEGGGLSPTRLEEIARSLDAAANPVTPSRNHDGRAKDREPTNETSHQRAVEGILEEPHGIRPLDFSRLEEIVAHLGGHLLLQTDGNGPSSFQLQFEAHPLIVEQVEALLSPSHPDKTLAPELCREDRRMEKILETIKEFMKAFSEGDLKRAQESLLFMTNQDEHVALYTEIGTMARQLHSSLQGFTSTLDPALKEMVEDKLPDSGNRLEHILELTERAANTTLDHVETIQKRNERDLELVAQLGEMVGELRAVGGQAEKKLGAGSALTAELSASILQTRDDLTTILMAQDYQDLTGQVVLKIIQLLKDLEKKLVNVIQVFGVKIEAMKKGGQKELYGPAHNGKAGALRCQDDVDALLADFGF